MFMEVSIPDDGVVLCGVFSHRPSGRINSTEPVRIIFPLPSLDGQRVG